MHPRRRLVAALTFVAFALVGIEETIAHTDDGCELETHCNACLLQLGTPAVVAAVFALPPVARLDEPVSTTPVVSCDQAELEHASSRGPPELVSSVV
jgi:hypothetical protein